MTNIIIENPNKTVTTISVEHVAANGGGMEFEIIGSVAPIEQHLSGHFQVLKLRVNPTSKKVSVWSSSCLNSEYPLDQIECMSEMKRISEEVLELGYWKPKAA